VLLPTVPIKEISRTVLAFILSRTSGMNGQKLKRDEKFGLISSKLNACLNLQNPLLFARIISSLRISKGDFTFYLGKQNLAFKS
jgi:hypothetical protein